MYRITKFGVTNLQQSNQVDWIGSGRSPSSYLLLPEGGAIDHFGQQRKQASIVERSKTMRITGNNQQEVSEVFSSLAAKQGQKDKLFRQTVDGDIHWVWARFVDLQAERNYQLTPYKRIQDVSLIFECMEAQWNGLIFDVWTFGDGYYFDGTRTFGGGKLFNLTHDAATVFTIAIGEPSEAVKRAPSRSVKITITAGSSPITALSIARTDGEILEFSGSISQVDPLVIDSGVMQCFYVSETDAYADLSFSSTADMAAWFTLQPGVNEITVTITGGGTGSTIRFEYTEKWN